MFEINPDDLFSKTDQLLFCILSELKQLNKSLRPIAKDTVIKKPKTQNAQKKKGKTTKLTEVPNERNGNL
jgi:hypothetical protein